MLAALVLPRLLDKISDRTMMSAAAAVLTAGLVGMAALFGAGAALWPVVLGGWFVLGIAYSMSVTPSGRLLRRSAKAEDRPAVFAAQFALSHVCWLISYPIAGLVGAYFGQTAAFISLAIIAGIGTVAALWVWPASDPDVIGHSHDDLPNDHPHIREAHANGAKHSFIIDDLHPVWPGRS